MDAVPNMAAGGSSPRIRGESLIDKRRYEFSGIIPANTGRMLFVS